MSEFDEYIRQGEPGRIEKATAWKAAIGLQDVDGLKPSAYLVDTAKRHIQGDITIDQVKGLIDSYYKSRQGRLSIEEERTEEADKVSARITELLQEYPFWVSVCDCHRHGKFRPGHQKSIASSAMLFISVVRYYRTSLLILYLFWRFRTI